MKYWSLPRFAPQPHSRQLKELNLVKYGESLVQNRMYSIEIKFDTFPLLLKEGWPDHFINMIPILIPAGVVDLDFHQAQLQVFLKHKKSQLCSYLYCVVF